MLDKKRQIEAGSHSQNLVIDGNQATVQFGVSFEQYKQDLREKEEKIEALMYQFGELKGQSKSNENRQHELATELAAVQQKLQNTESSYQEYIQELQQRIKRLEVLKGQLPDEVILAAKQALQNGDNEQADQLFAKVQEQAEAPIKVAAEASFQRAQIATDNIDYHNALAHYERAAQLTPDNTLYLNEYGSILHDMGYVNKAIEYYEQALTSDINTYGENHPQVATYRNNLGSAWKQKGELDKAIGYFEQALASDINTYGEDHPNVATERNNLGLAWQGKGELDKAIEYLQLAFDGVRNVYGDEHPSTQTVKANLEIAAQAKSIAEK